jgi:PAS domain S-box-containing protein
MNYNKMTKAELLKTITSLQSSGGIARRPDASGWQRRARELQARQQAEEALRASEERFRAIYEFSPIGIVNIDARGKFIRANSAYQKIFGYTEEELRSLSFADITHPDDHEASSQTFKELIEGRRDVDRLEKRCIRKNGQIVWIRLTRYPIRDTAGNFLHTVSMVEDISKRKQAEEALRQSEAWFKEIFDGSRDAIFLVERNARFMAVNKAASELTGYTQDELLAMAILDLHDEEDLHAFRNHFGAIMSGVEATTEALIRRKDGNKIPVEFSNRQFVFRGQPIMHTTARDISERKRMENALQHAQKLESLGILAGGIAHDFNNLLVGILGNAGLTRMELPPDSPARASIQEIETAAQRAAELTNQMLAYSGKGKFVVEALHLSKLTLEMLHLLGTAISKKVRLAYDFQEDPPAIEGDATQLRQVIMNLITNASEAIGDREGVITLSTGTLQAARADFAGSYLGEDLPEGRYVYLEVADDGCGMDAETKSKIFDPFFTTKFTGRGLGLAAVLGIVRSHHGAIKVESEPERGTKFRVFFPASAKQAESPKPARADKLSAAEQWRGSGAILVVDDEKAVQQVTKKVLEHFGFTALTASDGREGVEILRRHGDKIKAVLLDLTMPRLGGEEAFREMRKVRRDVRIILSSGYSEQEVINHFKATGLAGFIQKPYQPLTLIEKLREVLEAPS